MGKFCAIFISLTMVMSLYAKAQEIFSQYENIVFGCATEEIESFRTFALQAKECGATHIAIQAEDLPLAYWELEPKNDPYPAWVIINPGLLKINPPAKLKPYIPGEYGKAVMSILEQRCRVLRQMDLKASFHTFEPQMLPEKFFLDHPSWRGPQVDNPMRSRVDRFAPSMSHPEVLALYSEAMGLLKQGCPEIDILEFRTNDSGAGIEWSDALYAGSNGNNKYRSQKMSTRVHRFLTTLQGTKDDFRYISDIHVYNTKEDQKEVIAHHLDAGQALDNVEGPDATPFKFEIGSLLYYRRPFAPVPGIPWPVTFLAEVEEAVAGKAKRLFVLMGDRHNRDLYFNIYNAFLNSPSHSAEERLGLLREIALAEVGEEASGHLIEAWLALHNAEKLSKLLSSGGTIFILGCVHQRWIVRPLVPFPGHLTDDEKGYYRKYQFQARTERHANDLLDLQGTRFVDGFNGYRLTKRILDHINREVNTARHHLQTMRLSLSDDVIRKYDLLEMRLQVFQCLVRNAGNAIHYQVVLEEETPGSRQELMKIARSEMDNTIELIQLLGDHNQMLLLDHTAVKCEEYHRILGPDMIDQLEKKVRLMNKYWNDYKIEIKHEKNIYH